MRFSHAVAAAALVVGLFFVGAAAIAQPPAPAPAPVVPPAPPAVTIAPKLILPKTVAGDPSTFIVVSPVEFAGDDITWNTIDPGLSLLPPELLSAQNKAVVMGARPGDYRLQGVTTAVVGGKAKLSPFATVVVTINGVPVPPPAPAPSPTPGPAPVPVETPSAEMQALVAPIRLVMHGEKIDPTKRSAWASAWGDYSAAVATAPIPPAGIAKFKAEIGAFLEAAAARGGLAGAFPGFTAALNTAFNARFGTADGTLDAARAVEFAKAVAWACQ